MWSKKTLTTKTIHDTCFPTKQTVVISWPENYQSIFYTSTLHMRTKLCWSMRVIQSINTNNRVQLKYEWNTRHIHWIHNTLLWITIVLLQDASHNNAILVQILVLPARGQWVSGPSSKLVNHTKESSWSKTATDLHLYPEDHEVERTHTEHNSLPPLPV